jgi:hypothetical protein
MSNERRLEEIIRMKMAWLYLMSVSAAIFIGTLIPGLFRLDSNGADWLVVLLFCFTGISIVSTIISFRKAAKLGKEEDDRKRPLPPGL